MCAISLLLLGPLLTLGIPIDTMDRSKLYSILFGGIQWDTRSERRSKEQFTVTVTGMGMWMVSGWCDASDQCVECVISSEDKQIRKGGGKGWFHGWISAAVSPDYASYNFIESHSLLPPPDWLFLSAPLHSQSADVWLNDFLGYIESDESVTRKIIVVFQAIEILCDIWLAS